MKRLLRTTILSVPFGLSLAGAQAAPTPTPTAGLAEVVVTAQRRAENPQKVAIPLTTIAGSALLRADVSEPGQLSHLVPSLVMQPTGGNGNTIYLRGVGTAGSNAFAENAIGVNLDGVFIGRPTGLDGLFYDLDRVEVLKGPQGTLYGRNATGGAINIETRQPRLNATDGDLNVEYGNYNNRKVEGGVTVPLAADLAVRLAGQYAAHDGYLSDGYDDEDQYAVRANALWKPTSAISVQIGADYNHQGGKGPGSVLLPANGSDGVTPAASERIGGSDPRSIAALTARYPGLVNSGTILPPKNNGFLDGKSGGVASTITADTAAGTVTLLPAYRDTAPDFLFYRPGFLGNQTEDTKQESTELRFTSPNEGKLRYVVGGYFFHELEDFTAQFTQGDKVGTQTYGDLGTTSYAVFGQGSYRLTNKWRLVGGLRYTDENKTMGGGVRTNAPDVTNVPFTNLSGNNTFTNVTYKIGTEYDLAPQSLLYANVATGFKAGGFYASAGNSSFAPEKLTAYTVGSKNRFLDNSLQLNLEAFYWQYHNQQISYVGPVQSVPGTYVAGGVTSNVGQARMYGLDTDLQYRLTLNDKFTVNVQYLNAKYTSFVYNAISGNGQPLATSCAATLDTSLHTVSPAKIYTLDCSGKSGINAPKLSLTLDYEHTYDLENGMSLIADVNTRIQTSRYLAIDYLNAEIQPTNTMSNASLTLQAADAKWAVTGFVNNFENATVMNQVSLRPIANAVYAGLDAPRTYGLRGSYHF